MCGGGGGCFFDTEGRIAFSQAKRQRAQRHSAKLGLQGGAEESWTHSAAPQLLALPALPPPESVDATAARGGRRAAGGCGRGVTARIQGAQIGESFFFRDAFEALTASGAARNSSSRWTRMAFVPVVGWPRAHVGESGAWRAAQATAEGTRARTMADLLKLAQFLLQHRHRHGCRGLHGVLGVRASESAHASWRWR